MISKQKGFTVLEIILVLLILGILAAIALPRYLDIQNEARNNAIEGALAAGASQIAMQYARDLLADPPLATATSWSPATPSYTIQLGDFSATLTQACGTNAAGVTINDAGSPVWVVSVTRSKTKSFTVCGS